MKVELPSEKVFILDPSDKFRPEKDEEQFRDFTKNCELYDRVRMTYHDMHTRQSMDYVQQKHKEWLSFDHAEMTVMEAVKALDTFVDMSDPDVDIPNSVHAFQTAERIREKHPDKEWFQLTGLIHDIGKIMALWGEPQFSTVGDTFPAGCAYSDKIVFGKEDFRENPDFENPAFNTRLGVYSENCGLDHVTMSWGHDEYMYHVMKNHKTCTLPEEAFYIVRYHSFYPWHTEKEYMYLCNNKDMQMLDWVLEFNKFDLYSKADEMPDPVKLAPYYESLAEKYLPGKIKF